MERATRPRPQINTLQDFMQDIESFPRFIGGSKKVFLVVCHIRVEIFLLVNHFFDATHTSNSILFKRQANCR